MQSDLTNSPALYKSENRYDLVLSVLDTSLGLLFLEVFKNTRYYDLGLEFYYICQEEIQKHKDQIEPWKYDSYQEELISLKLEMLDCLNEWEEYISFTHEILDTVFIENRLNFFLKNVDERYIIKDKNGRRKIHFLCKYENRYDIIRRKIFRRNAGKSVEHLKKHQQSELTYEEIERRYKTVIDFFKLSYKLK